MRDYLKRLYGVDVLSVRSYVEQQKVTRLRPLGKFGYGKLRRPMSKKKMTVEMKTPFVWPEAPADMTPYVFFFVPPFSSFGFWLGFVYLLEWVMWANEGVCVNYRWEYEQFHKAAKYQNDIQDKQRPDAGMKANTDERDAYAEEAKKLLDGSKPWRPTWQALGLSYDRTGLGKSSTSS